MVTRLQPAEAGDTWYSIADAASLCGVSPDTIKRRIHDGTLSGARRGYGPGPGGPWLIPETDLRACGLLRDGSIRVDGCHPDESSRHGQEEAVVKAELDVLRRRLAGAEATIAAQRTHLLDLRSLLAGSPPTGHGSDPTRFASS